MTETAAILRFQRCKEDEITELAGESGWLDPGWEARASGAGHVFNYWISKHGGGTADFPCSAVVSEVMPNGEENRWGAASHRTLDDAARHCADHCSRHVCGGDKVVVEFEKEEEKNAA